MRFKKFLKESEKIVIVKMDTSRSESWYVVRRGTEPKVWIRQVAGKQYGILDQPPTFLHKAKVLATETGLSKAKKKAKELASKL